MSFADEREMFEKMFKKESVTHPFEPPFQPENVGRKELDEMYNNRSHFDDQC